MGDSVLDLQEGVCVLCVFVCVCVSTPEALQRGCAYSPADTFANTSISELISLSFLSLPESSSLPLSST